MKFLIYEKISEVFFDMCRNSKFHKTSTSKHFYVVVECVLTSAWVTFRVVIEVEPKTTGKIINGLLCVVLRAARYRRFKSLYY